MNELCEALTTILPLGVLLVPSPRSAISKWCLPSQEKLSVSCPISTRIFISFLIKYMLTKRLNMSVTLMHKEFPIMVRKRIRGGINAVKVDPKP